MLRDHSFSQSGKFSFSLKRTRIAARARSGQKGQGGGVGVMDKLLIERVRELEREIAEIAVASHAYFACRKPDQSEKLLHERRLERLQEIKQELTDLRRSAA